MLRLRKSYEMKLNFLKPNYFFLPEPVQCFKQHKSVAFFFLIKKKVGWLPVFIPFPPKPPITLLSHVTSIWLVRSQAVRNFASVSVPSTWQGAKATAKVLVPLSSAGTLNPLSCFAPQPLPAAASLGSSKLFLRSTTHSCLLLPLPKLVWKLKDISVLFKAPNPYLKE